MPRTAATKPSDQASADRLGDPGVTAKLDRLRKHLSQEVPGDSIEVLRRIFGLMMAWQMTYYLFDGRGERLLWGTLVQFPYPGFAWLPLLPDFLLKVLCWILLASALSMALGTKPRISAGLFGLGYGYLMLVDMANFNNHDYLIALLGLLLAVVPETAVGRPWAHQTPRTLPAWSLWLLRFQIAVPYTLGGFAKLNYDWAIRHEPMTLWLSQGRAEGLDRIPKNPEMWGSLVSVGGIFFDLLIVPLLLWRRTRLPAYLACVAFHVANSQMFTIGPFPWLMIVATLIFFSPAWPQKFHLTVRQSAEGSKRSAKSKHVQAAPRRDLTTAGFAALALWIAFQVLVPFRHYLYPGNVNWTGQGDSFAWRMKLKDQVGTYTFSVKRSGQAWQPVEGLDFALTPRQTRKVESYPLMMLHFARFLEEQLDPVGVANLQVRVETSMSLNGREEQRLIKPKVDLLTITPGTPAEEWIVPLQPTGD